MKIKSQPAKTYDLNILASALSKLQIEKLEKESVGEVHNIIKYCIKEIGEVKKPLVPHNDSVLLDETKTFIDKLIKMLSTEKVKKHLNRKLSEKIISLLKEFEFECDKLKLQKVKFFITQKQIAEMFHFDEMWDIAQNEADEELKVWKHAKNPIIPKKLKLLVEEEETKKLIYIFNTEIFGFAENLKVNSKVVKNDSDYHLFWDITDKGVNYVTPEFYGMHNQLSFDLPHNVSHLAHLNLLKSSALSYVDDMATRAFFEAIAVFSEYEMLEKLKNNPEVAKQIKSAFKNGRDMEHSKLLKWMIEDREYQLKLRNARLLSDIFVMQGLPFDDVVEKVAKYLDIPLETAKSEVLKYYPWTGLGAIYTLGYRKLLKYGVKELKDVIKNKPPKNWKDFLK